MSLMSSDLRMNFINGYQDGDRVMYVSIYNNKDVLVDVTSEISSSWTALWKEESDLLDHCLAKDMHLAGMVGKMFFVWEGNHRLTAW